MSPRKPGETSSTGVSTQMYAPNATAARSAHHLPTARPITRPTAKTTTQITRDESEDTLALVTTVPEAELEQTEHGLVPKSDGWFVLNARDARWRPGEGRGAYCIFEGDPEFSQYAIHLVTLAPGEVMAMYHWEADQEDVLVLAGEALLVV